MPAANTQRVCFGPFEVDRHSGELFKFGQKLKLQGQPVEVLSILLERPGELASREELCHRLWPEDTFVVDPSSSFIARHCGTGSAAIEQRLRPGRHA